MENCDGVGAEDCERVVAEDCDCMVTKDCDGVVAEDCDCVVADVNHDSGGSVGPGLDEVGHVCHDYVGDADRSSHQHCEIMLKVLKVNSP